MPNRTRNYPRIPSARDPQRPRYHYLPPRNWMNDPNGLIQWQGQYHMFYQHNPHAPIWGPMYWGHAASTDLLHWSDLPIALAPSADGPDSSGCWSGVIVEDRGTPTLIYTGFQEGSQRPCLATSSDGLRTWQKDPHNPIIARPPPGSEWTGFRDHSLWREGEDWYMLIGSGVRDQGGTVLLYRSRDLHAWEYLHPLTDGSERSRFSLFTGEMWECPSFFSLMDQSVLLISACDRVENFTAAFAGEYHDQQFNPHSLAVLDHGGVFFYAPQTFLDDAGRRVMFGWMREGRSRAAQVRAGWAGVMSLPRLLYLDREGRLCQAFLPELSGLRQTHQTWQNLAFSPEEPIDLATLPGRQLEIQAEIPAAYGGQTRLSLVSNPQAGEETRLVFDWSNQSILLDGSHSSYRSRGPRSSHTAPLLPARGGCYRLHLFLDVSALEVLVEGHTAISTRVYPHWTDQTTLRLHSAGCSQDVTRLDCWTLAPVWD